VSDLDLGRFVPHSEAVAACCGTSFFAVAIAGVAGGDYSLRRTKRATARGSPQGPCRACQSPESPDNAGAEAMSAEDDAALEREFDVLMAKAGAKIPPDRKAGVIAGYKDMKRMAALLRQPRSAAAEPSNIYSLTGFARGKRR
jgi:hypothetical protein